MLVRTRALAKSRVPARTSTSPIARAARESVFRAEWCVSTSTSSAFTSRSEAKARARFSETKVLPSPGRELRHHDRPARVLVAGSVARRPGGHQVALDQAKLLDGARPLRRGHRDPEAGELATVKDQLGGVGRDRLGRRSACIERPRRRERRRRSELRTLALPQQRRRAFDQPNRFCHHDTLKE